MLDFSKQFSLTLTLDVFKYENVAQRKLYTKLRTIQKTMVKAMRF